MAHYELTCIFKPNLEEDSLKKLTKKVQECVENEEGKVVGKEIWGLIDLAYTINSFQKGYYIYLQIDISGNNVNKLKKSLNLLDENILRHLEINVDKHEKLPTVILQNRENNEK